MKEIIAMCISMAIVLTIELGLKQKVSYAEQVIIMLGLINRSEIDSRTNKIDKKN